MKVVIIFLVYSKREEGLQSSKWSFPKLFFNRSVEEISIASLFPIVVISLFPCSSPQNRVGAHTQNKRAIIKACVYNSESFSINRVHSTHWEMWILSNMRFWKCEFCEKWDFEIVNLVKNVILKMCILSKNVILKMWILSKMGFWKCEFC